MPEATVEELAPGVPAGETPVLGDTPLLAVAPAGRGAFEAGGVAPAFGLAAVPGVGAGYSALSSLSGLEVEFWLFSRVLVDVLGLLGAGDSGFTRVMGGPPGGSVFAELPLPCLIK